MDSQAELVEKFDRSRSQLRAVAFRMLGSADEADDAVQETWLRASRADAREIANVTGWLTTIVGRICLDMLRSRRRRSEDFIDAIEFELAELRDQARGPEDEVVLADSVGLALLVVLDALGPAERVAFVLHDLFSVPFQEIAEIVERSPDTTKKLASRARRRVRGTAAISHTDLSKQRHVVDAFLTAARTGELDALLDVLAPDVVRRADRGALRAGGTPVLRGARPVAEETVSNSERAYFARPVLVDGAVGAVVAPRGRLGLVLRLTTDADRITEIDVISDPARLRQLELAVLDVEAP